MGVNDIGPFLCNGFPQLWIVAKIPYYPMPPHAQPGHLHTRTLQGFGLLDDERGITPAVVIGYYQDFFHTSVRGYLANPV